MTPILRVATALTGLALSACANPAARAPNSAAPAPATPAAVSGPAALTELPDGAAADSSHPAGVTGSAPGATIQSAALPPSGARIQIRCGLGTPTGHPALLVVDGVVLGLRPDGTVDHAAAQTVLDGLDAGEIVSVIAIKAAEAVERFGPGGHLGAILIATSRRSER